MNTPQSDEGHKNFNAGKKTTQTKEGFLKTVTRVIHCFHRASVVSSLPNTCASVQSWQMPLCARTIRKFSTTALAKERHYLS